MKSAQNAGTTSAAARVTWDSAANRLEMGWQIPRANGAATTVRRPQATNGIRNEFDGSKETASGPRIAPTPKQAWSTFSIDGARGPKACGKALLSPTSRPPEPSPTRSAAVTATHQAGAAAIRKQPAASASLAAAICALAGTRRTKRPETTIEAKAPANDALSRSPPPPLPTWKRSRMSGKAAP